MTADERLRRLLAQLQQDLGLVEQLTGEEHNVVRDALNGESVHDIAGSYRLSEEAVWDILSRTARLASGQEPAQRVETGGLGSDTDPGISGGYGDTGFGAIGNEPPEPTPEEPVE